MDIKRFLIAVIFLIALFVLYVVFSNFLFQNKKDEEIIILMFQTYFLLFLK